MFQTNLKPQKKQLYLLPIEQLPVGDYLVSVELSRQGEKTVKA
jgi:hypothetical protein